MKPCIECGTELSESALVCAKCSNPNPFGKVTKSQSRTNASSVWLILVIALVLAYVFITKDYSLLKFGSK